MTKERIEIIRQSLIPFVKKELLDINYEGLGVSDAEEFEKDLNEVLDMAIKDVEQQPSEGKVSMEVYKQVTAERDIAIEQLKELGYEFGEKIRTSEDCIARQPLIDNWNSCADMLMGEGDSAIVMDWIFDAPPVTPTQSWIPVSERLPKESDGAVLISVDLEVKTGRYSEFSNTWYKGDMHGVGGDDPIAWQPLPQPYEEKSGSENE